MKISIKTNLTRTDAIFSWPSSNACQRGGSRHAGVIEFRSADFLHKCSTTSSTL